MKCTSVLAELKELAKIHIDKAEILNAEKVALDLKIWAFKTAIGAFEEARVFESSESVTGTKNDDVMGVDSIRAFIKSESGQFSQASVLSKMKEKYPPAKIGTKHRINYIFKTLVKSGCISKIADRTLTSPSLYVTSGLEGPPLGTKEVEEPSTSKHMLVLHEIETRGSLFCVNDILASLKQCYQDMDFTQKYVYDHILRLKKKGVILGIDAPAGVVGSKFTALYRVIMVKNEED